MARSRAALKHFRRHGVLDVFFLREDANLDELLPVAFLYAEEANSLGILLLFLGGQGLPLSLGQLLRHESSFRVEKVIRRWRCTAGAVKGQPRRHRAGRLQ